jgi:hypothetical protein
MADVETTMATLAKMDEEQQEGMPSAMTEATIVANGSSQNADSFHTGSGTARVYRLADGSHVLRFEDFKVTNGPDLRVILSPHPNPKERDDATADGYVELEKLKGNGGNQNYVLPEGLDPGAFRSVVIHCKPFRVIFSTAPLISNSRYRSRNKRSRAFHLDTLERMSGALAIYESCRFKGIAPYRENPLHEAPADACDSNHYHASGTVVTLRGETLTEPDPSCGFASDLTRREVPMPDDYRGIQRTDKDWQLQ